MELIPNHVIPFGKANGLQSNMLLLAGYVPQENTCSSRMSMSTRLSLISKARGYLVTKTGMDHGFDLSKWHLSLLSDETLREEYTFTYAWTFVKSRIETACGDPERSELLKHLSAISENQLGD